MFSNDNQRNADNDQRRLRLEPGFVVLPGHPFYGREVYILSRHPTATTVWCLIASPDNPEFHYRIPERWLAPCSPPPPSQPAPVNTPVVLSLSALDKMTQRLLIKRRTERSNADAQPILSGLATDLGPNPNGPQTAPEQQAVLLGLTPSERREQ